ncbi:MAG TPA: hypothetical protein VKK31_12840 [Thermoanaerobaculia bacterium]|nr:hypothetical protein [Thermoanaerobaculia bacterium]
MNAPPPLRLSPAAAARAVWALFAVGLAIAVLMLARSQVGGDQLNLLARGWLLADEGRWISYGNPMSTGGKAPGGITSLLVGLPLMVWRDHRAPSVLILLLHVLAYWLLDGTLKRILSPRERVLLAVLYWLNPWQLYFASFLWNPNYLYFFGAVHLWSALGQRERGRFWPSFLHAAGLALAFQIHASFLLLAVASLLLWLRGYFRIHWGGAAAGGVLASLPLIPWAMELVAHPAIVTEASKGFLGRGLVLVFPLARGLLYWLRYASIGLSERMTDFDFSGLFGSDPWLGRGVGMAAGALAVTIVLPLLANVRLWRRGRRLWRGKLAAGRSDRDWLKGYARVCFVAAVIVFSLSPTTIMMWQGLILLHAAILPVIFWLGALGRTRLASRVSKGIWIYAAVEIVLLLAIAFGNPQYRCGGRTDRTDFSFNLRHDHPMLRELKIQQTCPWPVNVPGGWWPDVLPVPSPRVR